MDVVRGRWARADAPRRRVSATLTFPAQPRASPARTHTQLPHCGRRADILTALERALDVEGPPPTLLLLNSTGGFIGDVCTELGAAAAGGPMPGVVVLLGDDRGLTGQWLRASRW